MMKHLVLAFVALVFGTSAAFAGAAPAPEMGDGVTGLIAVAVAAAGYLAVRHIRRKRA